jgi:hypothetical protein
MQGVLSSTPELLFGMASHFALPNSEGNDGTERLLSTWTLLAILSIYPSHTDTSKRLYCYKALQQWKLLLYVENDIKSSVSVSTSCRLSQKGAHTCNCTNRAPVAVRNGIVMSTETLINCPAAAAGRHQEEGGG